MPPTINAATTAMRGKRIWRRSLVIFGLGDLVFGFWFWGLVLSLLLDDRTPIPNLFLAMKNGQWKMENDTSHQQRSSLIQDRRPKTKVQFCLVSPRHQQPYLLHRSHLRIHFTDNLAFMNNKQPIRQAGHFF